MPWGDWKCLRSSAAPREPPSQNSCTAQHNNMWHNGQGNPKEALQGGKGALQGAHAPMCACARPQAEGCRRQGRRLQGCRLQCRALTGSPCVGRYP